MREFLTRREFEERRFACSVPRLRYTPYWKEGRKAAPEEIARKTAVNEQFAEADHAKFRAAIVAWVRQKGHKALLCPEMTYQVGCSSCTVSPNRPARRSPRPARWWPSHDGGHRRDELIQPGPGSLPH